MEYDDLINEILEEKPQDKKSEAFFVQETKKEPHEEEYLKWSKVPARKRNPVCGYCKIKMPGGTWGWRSDCEDNKGNIEVYWWCCKCLEGILEPPSKRKAT